MMKSEEQVKAKSAEVAEQIGRTSGKEQESLAAALLALRWVLDEPPCPTPAIIAIETALAQVASYEQEVKGA